MRVTRRERVLRGVKIAAVLFLGANLAYALKSAMGINLDPRHGPEGHHGDLFPMGEWLVAPLRSGSVFDPGPPDRPAAWYTKQKKVEEICRVHPDRCPWYRD